MHTVPLHHSQFIFFYVVIGRLHKGIYNSLLFNVPTLRLGVTDHNTELQSKDPQYVYKEIKETKDKKSSTK